MKITIITVCYNSATYISNVLRSVDTQTWPDIEHLIIDGGSTDGTLDLLAAHARDFRRVVSEPDSGIYDAMNKGLRLATGSWIGFLNADDVFAHAGVVALVAEAAASNRGARAVYGDLAYTAKQDLGKLCRRWRSGVFSRSRLRFGWMPPHPTFYIRADQLAQVGRFDQSLKIAGDYDFMLRYLNRDGVEMAYVPETMVLMRSGGVSNRSLWTILTKSREDLRSIRAAGFSGWPTLICKNARKLPQFLFYAR